MDALSDYKYLCTNIKNAGNVIAFPAFFRNSGKLLLLPYTKGFGRITHFLGNDLATVLYTAFCLDLLFKQLVGYKCTKDIGTIIQKREKASTLL